MIRIYKSLFLTIIFFFDYQFLLGQGQEDSLLFKKIDSIVITGIKEMAYPGAVLYVSKGDSTIIHKSFGYHTYDSTREVKTHHIYDLASITKVTAGTLALMKLYENQRFKLDDQVKDYVEGINNKRGKETFRRILAHHSGWYPWVPYYKEVRNKKGKYKGKSFSSDSSSAYPYQIARDLYMHKDFYQRIKKFIRKADFNPDQGYKYSGLFFYLIPELVKDLTDTTFSDYLESNFYQKLGAKTITFNPLEKFPDSLIVPTEIDTFFRIEPIHGRVHDEGAILMKGISGNAGLFATAEDLAKVWMMFLKRGKVDTIQFLKETTVDLFTTHQFPNEGNRRGLGFDKPLLNYDSIASSVAKSASSRSYGHTGYTGPIVWADPDNELLFIFLCNRVYPNRQQKKLYELNIRPALHQILYDLID